MSVHRTVDAVVAVAAISWVGCAGETPLLQEQPDTFFYFQDVGWSPDGMRLIFSAGRFTANWEGDLDLYLIDPDGSHLVQLIENDESDVWGSFSPSGDQIVFNTRISGNADLYLIASDGSGLTALTNDPADDAVPTWSPDGSKIAFMSSRTGNSQIHIMNADGSMVQNVSNNEHRDEHPRWSPDGSRIAFHSGRDGADDTIYLMNADGSEQRQLVAPELGGILPNWLPSSDSVAFATDDGLYVVSIHGNDATMRIPGGIFAAWSPDESRVAYIAERSGTIGIYVMNADGTGVRPLIERTGSGG